jgi:hypothetical protein
MLTHIECLNYTVAFPGFAASKACGAEQFYMCGEEAWLERLINGDPTPLSCLTNSCAKTAQSSMDHDAIP